MTVKDDLIICLSIYTTTERTVESRIERNDDLSQAEQRQVQIQCKKNVSHRSNERSN